VPAPDRCHGRAVHRRRRIVSAQIEPLCGATFGAVAGSCGGTNGPRRCPASTWRGKWYCPLGYITVSVVRSASRGSCETTTPDTYTFITKIGRQRSKQSVCLPVEGVVVSGGVELNAPMSYVHRHQYRVARAAFHVSIAAPDQGRTLPLHRAGQSKVYLSSPKPPHDFLEGAPPPKKACSAKGTHSNLRRPRRGPGGRGAVLSCDNSRRQEEA